MPLPQIQGTSLEIYASCPKKLEYSLRKEIPALSKKALVLRNMVTGAYLKMSRRGRPQPWRQITSEIDKLVFKDLPPRTHPDYENITDELFRKSIRNIRNVKKAWYDPFYLEETYNGFPNMNIGMMVDGVLLHDTIDLVLYNQDELVCCIFTDIEPNLTLMYNSIRLRTQALMLSQELSRPVTRLRSFSWVEDTDKIYVKDLKIHNQEEFMNTTSKTVSHIVNGINNKVFYPAINAQCATCPFANICSF